MSRKQVVCSIPVICLALAAAWMPSQKITSKSGSESAQAAPIPSGVVYGTDLEGSGSSQRTLFIYKVTAGANETIRDFHVCPLPGSKVSLKGTPRGMSGWTASQSNGCWNWVATGPGLTNGQTASFTVEAGSGFSTEDLKWVTTSDGNNDPRTGMIDEGPKFSDSDPVIRGPAISLEMTAGEPKIGTVMDAKIQAPLSGFNYKIHVLSVEPTQFMTHEEFASFVLQNNVPTSWGLLLNNLEGVMPTSEIGAGTITIPASTSLLALDFWLIAEITNPDDPDEKYRSLPVKLTFAAP